MLLLLCAIVPQGEGISLRKQRNQTWVCPPLIWWTAWLLLMGGYTFSGFTKLASPSWLDGSAMLHLLNNPLARPGFFRDWLLQMPDGFLRLLTWTALAGEVLSLPLALWRPTRLLAWLWMLLMQIAILFFVDFADLTAGMLVAHLFTFDPAWIHELVGKPFSKNIGPSFAHLLSIRSIREYLHQHHLNRLSRRPARNCMPPRVINQSAPTNIDPDTKNPRERASAATLNA